MALVGLLGLVRRFGLRSVERTEPRLLDIATVQQAGWSKRAELEAGLLLMGLLVMERCGLATTQLDRLASSIKDSSMNPAAFSCFPRLTTFANPSQPRVCSNSNSSSQQQPVCCVAAIPMASWGFSAWWYVLGREGRRTY